MKKKILISLMIAILTTVILIPMLVSAEVELPPMTTELQAINDDNTNLLFVIQWDAYGDKFRYIYGAKSSFTFTNLDTIPKIGRNNGFNYYQYTVSTDTWIQEDSVGAIWKSSDDIIYSNQDIYLPDGTTVFFSMPRTILRPLVQPQQMSQALSQVLIILPLLVGLIVSFLAFRKAWATLSRLLHKV